MPKFQLNLGNYQANFSFPSARVQSCFVVGEETPGEFAESTLREFRRDWGNRNETRNDVNEIMDGVLLMD